MFKRTLTKMTSAPRDYIGASGSCYRFQNVLQERPHIGRVWLATSGLDKFVLKDIPKDIFDNFRENILPRLRKSPYIRLPYDIVPGQQIYIYRYLTDDFLSLVKRGISLRARKQILHNTLLGIAELHDQDVVHLDIKPDNIMVESKQDGEDIIVESVQIIDLENAAYLPKGRCIKGMLAGNENWRSPEAHFKGELNKPTDIFSFAIVCIYAMLGRVIFGPDQDFRKHEAQGALPAFIRLQRQVSYFGDMQGIGGLSKHISDDDISCQVLQMLWDERADEHIDYRPFVDWPDVDPSFKDLIQKLANLDPSKRLTARQALEHPWFLG
ncbi:calcium/calmodulin dependent protein kinase, putative [Talaromyces stipitatus ATCC 10500]|uniref:Calcium/calmodulin dependent protein kinase, putative n=1 Tax=Talaromyces stipitatus (strain ATCC 10500 / CBS 375.48 / QM 6759 / NRRL 1006) TaxID=441959 RepID=B8MUQ5_TALSN|nr:calcium/calmodulin dependent protein kinase, putative [Talaromyces stipitatus ATCC 10500]EED11722.1 calcium/calmodulin dependent protein kinase, putative [Talaromyces stipitatus ATCC 10500]